MFLTCKSNFNGYFIEISDSWTDALGWTAQELMSKPYTEFLHPDDYEKTIKKAGEMVEDPSHIVIINFENRYKHKNGNYVWIRWRAYTDFEKECMVCTATALIDYKVNDFSGLDSEFWNSYVKHTPTFVAILNSHNQLEYINKYDIEIPYVKSLVNIIGKRIDDIFPEDLANKILYFIDICKESNLPYTKIFENNQDNNQYIVNFLPIKTSGLISGVMCEMYSNNSWNIAHNQTNKIIENLQEIK